MGRERAIALYLFLYLKLSINRMISGFWLEVKGQDPPPIGLKYIVHGGGCLDHVLLHLPLCKEGVLFYG